MKKLKLAFVTTIPTNTKPLISAVKTVNEKFGEIITVHIQTGIDPKDFSNMDEFIQFAQQSHITLVHLMGTFPDYDRLVSSLKNAHVPLLVLSPNKDQPSLSTVDPEDCEKISRYIQYGGKGNFENLLLYLANRFTGDSYDVAAPERTQWDGIYHPNFDHVLALDEYVGNLQQDKPTVGILFHSTQLRGEDTGFVDSLIKAVEQQGANAIALSFSGNLDRLIENYLMKEGKPIVDALVSTVAFSLSASSAEASVALKKLGVPVIKAVLTVNSFKDWRDTMQGLSIIDIPSSIVMPEFDGLLITVPIATMDSSEINPSTGTKILKFEPIPERVNKLARLS